MKLIVRGADYAMTDSITDGWRPVTIDLAKA